MKEVSSGAQVIRVVPPAPEASPAPAAAAPPAMAAPPAAVWVVERGFETAMRVIFIERIFVLEFTMPARARALAG